MTHYKVTIETSYSNRRHCTTQKEAAEFMGIKNSSKKALEARARQLHYTIVYND